MSHENVETVRGMLEAWNRVDFEGWVAAAHPEAEWSSAIVRQVEGPETVYRGLTAFRRFWDDWHALWDLSIEPTDIRDLGDTVVALARATTKGKAGGVEVEQGIGYVVEFEDGLVRRVRAYLSPEEALEAAGLTE